MTATQTVQRLSYVGDHLRGLAERPPTTPDEHRAAAAILLRYAATEAQNLLGHEREVEARVSTLTRLATAHTRLATL